MTIATPGLVHNDFLLSEGNGKISRKEVTVTSAGTAIKSGTVMVGAARANVFTAPKPGNVGNGAMGAVTLTALGTPNGIYRLVLTGSGATAAFSIIDPNGNTLATAGAVASAYSAHGLAFTLADGAVDFAAGDEIEITVDNDEFTYTPYAGSGTVKGVLYNDVPSAAGNYRAVMMVRDCEVARAALVGLDAAAEATLAGLGIIVCGVYSNR